MLRYSLMAIIFLTALLASAAPCAMVKMDLLAGIGDFEYCADTAWNVWAHPDYDFDAQSGWVGEYRSSITFRQTPSLRVGGSGSGDLVTIECVSSDSRSSTATYEFTDGGGAQPGNVQVAVPTGASPETAALRLAEAVNANQGAGGSNVVAASSSGSTVWVKPVLGWAINAFTDSDTSNVRILSNHVTWLYGFDPATPDNSVAVGWVKKTGKTVHPRNNAIYRIAAGEGIAGSNCQYFAVKNYSGSHAILYLSTSLRVDNRPSSLHTGDYITFRVDHLRHSGFANLGPGVQAEVKIGIRWADLLFEKAVPVSQNPVSMEVSAGPIPQQVSQISAHVRIDVSGDASGKELGVYVDGAHMFVTRAGQSQPQEWEVPVSRNRSCRTTKLYCKPDSEHDPYQIASDYDSVMLDESASKYVPLFRYLNPSIKIYLYESVTSTDFRDYRGRDPWYTNCPIPFGYILATGSTDWLYDNNAGFYVNEPYYPYSYCTRLTKPAFQALWAQRAADKARRWRYDGVWIDALAPLQELKDGTKILRPNREPWEVQQFLRAVLPVLRAAGLHAIHNVCGYSLETPPGSIYANPYWKPVEPYNSEYYLPASPATTADGPLQEWAFFYTHMEDGRTNVYRSDYWKRCLDDMDAIKRWNTATGDEALGPGYTKQHYLIVVGTDSTDDPAYGVDGWLQFGLCSYLLGQNDWTTFGCGVRPSYHANIDFSITRRLGVPISEHAAYKGDEYLRYRTYGPTTDGGAGGVVVVNANSEPRSYVLSFDAVDESGNPIPRNTTVVLKPHTGRIFINRQSAVATTVNVPSTVSPSEVVSISVGYVNNTGVAVRNLSVKMAVPAEMVYLAGSAEASGGSYDPVTNTVSWIIPSVEPGASGTRTFQAKVK